MRKHIFFGIIICAAIFIIGSYPSMDYDISSKTVATRIRPYEIILNSVIADNTPLDANHSYWDLIKPENGIFKKIPPTYNGVEIAFYCYGDGTGDGDPNAASFDFKIWAARWYSSAVLIYQGYAKCGELELSCDPNGYIQFNSGSLDPNQSYKWVDYIDPNGLGDAINGVYKTNNTATENGIARLGLDMRGYWILWAEITNMTSKPVTKVWCVCSGY